MYKVFKDNTCFILASSNDIPHIEDAITIYIVETSNIDNIIKKYSNNEELTIIILHNNINALINAFESKYKIRQAAGGWVFKDKQLLLINRLNHYDIPKGHLEKGESLEECAIREVEEETCVTGLKIINNIGISRHIYKLNNSKKQILKETHWYKMTTTFNGELIPQEEEGIEEAIWINKDKLNTYLPKMWFSLRDFYTNMISE